MRSHSPWNTWRDAVVAGPVAGARSTRRGRTACPGVPGSTSRPSSSRISQVVAGHGDAGGARADLAGAVGQEDVQHLGHADAVEDVDAEVARSSAGRARPAAPRRPTRLAARRPARRPAGRRAACWRRTSDRRRRAWRRTPWPARRAVRPGRRRFEHGGRAAPTAGTAASCRARTRRTTFAADRQRSSGRMPQHLGDRTSRRRPRSRRAGAWPPSACRWCRRCRARTPASRRSVPYTCVAAPPLVAAAISCVEVAERVAPASGLGTGPAARIPRSSGADAAADGGEVGELGADREQPGPGVAQQLGQALGAGHRRHRHRHRAHPHRGQEDHDEVRRVRHEHQHPLLGLEPEAAQAGRGPDDPLVQLGVGQVAGRAGQREPAPVAGRDPPVEQVSQALNRVIAARPVSRGARSRSRTAGR